MWIVPFTAGHGDGAPIMFVPFFGIWRKQVPANIAPFFGGSFIVGVTALDDKILHHSVELGAIKIFLACQIDEIGFVVGHIIVEFHYKTAQGCGYFDLVFLQGLVVVKKEVDGILFGKLEGVLFDILF